jgi:protein-disulfide isomerase
MKKETILLGIIAILVVIAAMIGASYYRESVQSERKPTITSTASLIREDSPTLGNADAKVTIVEFLDPECESCRAFNPTVKKLLKEYDGKIRLVVRYMPLHPNSVLAATFTEVAGEQGKYWQAQELLFNKQSEWGTKHGPPSNDPPPDLKVLFEKYAMELGLDLEKLNSAIKENRFSAKLERDKKDGQANGVRQTPTIFVNGRQLARLYEGDLKALIDEELKK